MKLLLTSGGLLNKTIVSALRELVGKDFTELNLVFIPTAANVETGDKSWLDNDIARCRELGFKEVDVVDIATVSQEIWQPKLEKADVIIVGGGNAYYLMSEMKKSGLADVLPGLLKTRVYVGISAGSMVMAPKLKEEILEGIYDEVFADSKNDGLGLVDFLVVPHLNSPFFPRTAELIDQVAKDVDATLYVIDDQTAIKVTDGQIEVVTEGVWKKYN